MCRSIKTLREPYAPDVTSADIQAAALQYVRKVSGYREPSRANAEVFRDAVDAITAATQDLLAGLTVGSHGGRDTRGRPAAVRAAGG
jgi:hypothetical protein